MIEKYENAESEVLITEFFHLMSQAARHVGETEILAMLAVHRTTLLRWRNGDTRIPTAARSLVAILASGRPPFMKDSAWRDFRFESDAIVTPCGRRFTATALGNLEWQDQYIEALKRRVERLETQLRLVQEMRSDGGANDPVERPGAADTARVRRIRR